MITKDFSVFELAPHKTCTSGEQTDSFIVQPFSCILPADWISLFVNPQCGHSNDMRIISLKNGILVRSNLVVPCFIINKREIIVVSSVYSDQSLSSESPIAFIFTPASFRFVSLKVNLACFRISGCVDKRKGHIKGIGGNERLFFLLSLVLYNNRNLCRVASDHLFYMCQNLLTNEA